MTHEICQVNVIHQDRIERAQRELPEANDLAEMAATFKLLGDPGRLKIVAALEACEMCVCDLAALLETTPSAISHQLRLLRTAGLVAARKEGKVVYYSPGSASVRILLRAGQSYLENEAV